MIIEFIPEHFYLSHHPDGHRSSHGCHFLPNFHHFHIHPITDIGTGSLSLSLSVPFQPRRVYCHPEAVVFVTPLPQQDYVRSVIVTFITFTFTPLPPSGQDHLSLSPSSPISPAEFIVILRLSHSSPYH